MRPPEQSGDAVGMAVGTVLSRATGFLRTIALASALGVTVASDAYNAANTAPTMVFTLVAGGALSASVLPLLVRSGPERTEVASVLLGATAAVGVVGSAVVAVTAPVLFRILAAGAAGRPDYDAYVALGTSWLRMFAPQVALYALSVLAVAIMTARHRLRLGATAPVATNLLTIAAALAFVVVSVQRPLRAEDVSTSGRLLLGWGTTAAVAAMTAIQLWGAWRCEPGLRLRLELRHRAVRQVARTGGWVLLYVGANQVGLAVVVAVASSAVGAVTAYQWGFMVMQLPYAIVGVSLISAALPRIAGGLEVTERRDRILGALDATVAWLVPAAVGLAVLARPVATVIVGPGSSALVGAAVVGFAVSLVPFSVFQLLTRSHYALGDARAPAFTNLGVNLVNVAGAFVVAGLAGTPTQRVVGLALSHAASYGFGCLLLGSRLLERHGVDARTVAARQGRVLVAAAPLAALTALVDRLPSVQSRFGAAVAVVIVGATGLVMYGAAARVLGIGRLGRRSVVPTV